MRPAGKVITRRFNEARKKDVKRETMGLRDFIRRLLQHRKEEEPKSPKERKLEEEEEEGEIEELVALDII